MTATMHTRNYLQVLSLLFCFLLVFSSANAQKSKSKSKAKTSASRSKSKYTKKKPVIKPVKPISNIAVSNPTITRSQAAFTFTNRWFDFGDIVQGQKVTHAFTFRNTGKDPLIISSIQPTCGCTVAEWPKTPIPPGQNGEIVVTFDSHESINQQNKTITILSNVATGTERLYIKGNVLPKK